MNIDRIARAMTGGRPRADFTARVMAPIHGRPRPGFTARVMAAAQGFSPANARTAGRSFNPGFRQALVLIPATVAIAAGVLVGRASRVELPVAPAAPTLATASLELRSAAPPQTPGMTTQRRVARHAMVSPVEEEAPPELPAIYMIPALDGPDDIAMKSIEPAGFTIPALDGPAPLKIADLKNFKEKP
jgi:hypothetical protein